MNKDALQKDILENVKEGMKPSDIKKKVQEKKEQNKPKSTIPTPPPPPPMAGVNDKRLLDKIEELQQDNRQLKKDVNFWSSTASNYLNSLTLLTAENTNLQENNDYLKERLKLGYSEPLRPQKRNMPNNSPREINIIQQAGGHLEPLTNSTTLRNRILDAEKAGTLEAYWELQKDLREAGEYSTKLLQFFQQDSDQVISFNYELAKILRGEYLNEK